MNCPKCHLDNESDALFCTECGCKLELACPECAQPNRPDSKFCKKCGHNLTASSKRPAKDLTPDDKVAKIQRYLPQGLAEKILSQRDKIEGERKQVTVMFCDLEGFTPLTEKLGPEDAFGLANPIYEILIHGTQEYGGTVNEMTGDGIVALFGAPIALEDAPQRAIRASLSIHREMVRFSDKMKQERPGLPNLKMRIGIHTGPVVVGTLGNDLRVEFKAVGDTVNLASRMEGLAEPGTTYVTGDTFKLTEGLFRFEGLGKREVKGKEEPVAVYRVIAPSTRRTRFDVAAERGLTPFVGRERELELLFDALERAKSGQGQAVSIVAPAGDGKSRHIYEFRKGASAEDVTFLEGKCLSYSRGVPYHPVIDILKGNFDIREDDGDEAIRDKVERGLKILESDDAATTPYLLELLSVKDSGIDQIPMSPEARKDRTIQALTRIVLKGAEIRPLIMIVEDLHWMDQSSEDVFKDLMEHIAGARVLLLFTYRPEYVHTWAGRSYHSQVNLNRLSNRETLAMVTHLLGTEQIPENLANLILEKTEGVPFFVEEFLKSLQELRIIQREDNTAVLAKGAEQVAIPSTIQDVLMARADALTPGAKEVLQTGSVIEREFRHEILQRVTGLPEPELLSHLLALKDAELLYERGVYPRATYVFKHALTREVLYDSVLHKRRRLLHERIAAVLEEIHKENLNEHYETLCEHFVAGEDFEKGAHYSRLASRKALKTGSYNDAIAYLRKCISCLESLPTSSDVNRQRVSARTALGMYYIQSNFHLEAKEAIDPIVPIAIENNYTDQLSRIYITLGTHSLYAKEDFRKAFEELAKAIDISEKENDPISVAQSNYWFGLALAFDCQFDRALHHFEKMVTISQAKKYAWAIAGTKAVMAYCVYCPQGKIDLAYQASHEAICAAEESADTWSKGVAYSSHGISCYYDGNLEEARIYLLNGIDYCEKASHVGWTLFTRNALGAILYETKDYPNSIDQYNTAFDRLGATGFLPSKLILMKTALAKATAIKENIYTNIDQLYKLYGESKSKLYFGPTARNIGEVLLSLGESHLSEAKNWIEKAIETDEKNCMPWDVAMDHMVYADWFRCTGDLPRGRDNLNKAIEMFEECGADGWVTRTEEKLAQL